MVDYFSALAILISPTFWWVWETLAVVTVFLGRAFKPFGKYEAMRFKSVNGVPIAIASEFVPLQKKQFRVKDGEVHTLQDGDFGFMKSDIIGAHPVVLYNIEKQRAIKIKWINESLELTKRAHNPKGKGAEFQINPDAADADDLLVRKTLGQLVQQTLMGHPNLLIMILLVGIGVFGGYLINSLINPPHVYFACPPGDACTPVGNSSATTRTVTA